MTFGEKVREERKRQGMSQDVLAEKMAVSRRTITSWETGRAFPRTRKTLDELSRILSVPSSYLLNEEESFVLDAGDQFGYRGRKGAEKLVEELSGLFAGGEMEEEDMDALMFAIQDAYITAKRNNKKYTPKKYRDSSPDDPTQTTQD